jgi:alpha-ribazole phosphatase
MIWVRPLQRSLKVRQLLAQRGFRYKIAPELAEINFGKWEGKPLQQIEKQQIDQ